MEMIDGLDRLRLAGPNGPRGRLTIVGDMSHSLCRDGNFEAALELERIWDELTRALAFFTVCLYPIECFEHSEARKNARTCALRTAQSVTPGTSGSASATSTEVAIMTFGTSSHGDCDALRAGSIWR